MVLTTHDDIDGGKGILDNNSSAITMSEVVPNKREVTREDVVKFNKKDVKEKTKDFENIKKIKTGGK